MTDYRQYILDRVPQFDERSRGFAAIAPDDTRNFRSYTWSCGIHLDQGREGACVGFGITHELAARPKVVLRDAAFALQLYSRARQLDEWDGEDYSGTSVLAGLKAAHELVNTRGRALINEYRWAFGIQDVLRVIGYAGPVVLGINWYEDMYDPDEHGFIHASGQIAGGHCILAKAVRIVRIDNSLPATWENVDKEKSYVTLHNSWGEGYGVGGDAYVSVNDLDKLLSDQGEAAIITSRSFDR